MKHSTTPTTEAPTDAPTEYITLQEAINIVKNAQLYNDQLPKVYDYIAQYRGHETPKLSGTLQMPQSAYHTKRTRRKFTYNELKKLLNKIKEINATRK